MGLVAVANDLQQDSLLRPRDCSLGDPPKTTQRCENMPGTGGPVSSRPAPAIGMTLKDPPLSRCSGALGRHVVSECAAINPSLHRAGILPCRDKPAATESGQNPVATQLQQDGSIPCPARPCQFLWEARGEKAGCWPAWAGSLRSGTPGRPFVPLGKRDDNGRLLRHRFETPGENESTKKEPAPQGGSLRRRPTPLKNGLESPVRFAKQMHRSVSHPSQVLV
jgi:hypothetical protein